MELAERILASVSERQVIRYNVRLQPAGGVNDKVFPPTYPAPRGQEGTRMPWKLDGFNRKQMSQYQQIVF